VNALPFKVVHLLLLAAALTRSAPTGAWQVVQESIPATGKNPAAVEHPAKYVLGPSDEIVILALNAEDIANKPIRITAGGDINLPMVGRIHVAGMTVEQLEGELTERLRKYIRNPDVAINVTQFKSQPVSVIGLVGIPGVIQLEGRKTLIEVLSMAGGLKQDAGYRVKITRKSEWGPIPLPSAKTDPSGDYSIAEVNIRGINDASHPEENIQILPFDVISVPRAEIVYVMGEVRKPGGFALNDKESISVLQVIALSEGLGANASAKNSKILRPVPGANHQEIAINLEQLLQGKTKDVTLQPDDILFVPNSSAKSAFHKTVDGVLSGLSGSLIYHVPF
jgi:polysaccharide export outer membrane protein